MPADPKRTKSILLVEDDPDVRAVIKKTLSNRGFDVWPADTGAKGLQLARMHRPDLILLDWILGRGPHGVEICANLKNFISTRSIPIIVLTGAKIEFDDELKALSSGADLYLTKDAVLGGTSRSARFFKYVQSLLDRPFKLSEAPVQHDASQNLQIDIRSHTVSVQGNLISDLSTKLFDLLYLLAKNYPQTVSRGYLVTRLWKNAVQDHEVDVAVCRLKARIERSSETILESVVRKGYRLKIAPSILNSPATSVAKSKIIPISPSMRGPLS